MIIETSGTYSRNYHRHRFYYNKSTDKTREKSGIDVVILRYMSTDRNTVWLMINGKKCQKQDVTEMRDI